MATSSAEYQLEERKKLFKKCRSTESLSSPKFFEESKHSAKGEIKKKAKVDDSNIVRILAVLERDERCPTPNPPGQLYRIELMERDPQQLFIDVPITTVDDIFEYAETIFGKDKPILLYGVKWEATGYSSANPPSMPWVLATRVLVLTDSALNAKDQAIFKGVKFLNKPQAKQDTSKHSDNDEIMMSQVVKKIASKTLSRIATKQLLQILPPAPLPLTSPNSKWQVVR